MTIPSLIHPNVSVFCGCFCFAVVKFPALLGRGHILHIYIIQNVDPAEHCENVYCAVVVFFM